MLLADRRLRQMEAAALDLACVQALRLARLGDPGAFATVYLAQLPHGPQPGQVWAEHGLADLGLPELWALAQHGDASLPDIEGMTAGQLRQLALEQS